MVRPARLTWLIAAPALDAWAVTPYDPDGTAAGPVSWLLIAVVVAVVVWLAVGERRRRDRANLRTIRERLDATVADVQQLKADDAAVWKAIDAYLNGETSAEQFALAADTLKAQRAARQ